MPLGWTLIRYEDLLLDADRTIGDLFPGRIAPSSHLQTDRAAKSHGQSRSFADARAYNLAKKWRTEKFTERAIAGHCSYANATLMAILQYTCP